MILRPLTDGKAGSRHDAGAGGATRGRNKLHAEVARASDGIVRGVVGWTDLTAPDAPERINDVAKDPLIKGLRPMLQDVADTFWILRDEARPALHAMAETGLCFDALIEPSAPAGVPIFVNFHPKLKSSSITRPSATHQSGGCSPGPTTIARVARTPRPVQTVPDWERRPAPCGR